MSGGIQDEGTRHLWNQMDQAEDSVLALCPDAENSRTEPPLGS